jgi:hypothetical protein
MLVTFLGALIWLYLETDGPHRISPENRDLAIAKVEKFYRQNGIAIQVVKIEKKAASPVPNTLATWINLQQWEYWVKTLNFRPSRITTITIPPLEFGGQLYYSGLAIQRGLGTDTPLAVAWCKNSVNGCALVLAHEIGHLLGAGHVGGAPNFMHAEAGQWAEDPWRMSRITKTQIRRRLKKIGLWEKARL